MYEYKVTNIIKVVDGDTIDVLIDVGFNMFRSERIRINRVDTPESITKDDYEKKFGLEAKEYVANWLKTQIEIKITKKIGMNKNIKTSTVQIAKTLFKTSRLTRV